MVRQLVKIILSTAILLSAALVLATPLRTTYQAKIVKPDGYPLEAANVNFRFTILDPAASCVLYVENYAAVNMTGTGGLISFALGAGTRSYPVSATTFASVFDNSTLSFPCQSPGIYNPTATDARKIVMQFQDSSGWQTLPAMAINAVPYAMYAAKSENATQLNGKSDSDFVEYSSLASLNCQSNEAIKFNGVSFSCIAVGVGSSGISSVATSGTVLTTGGTASAPVISITAASMSSDGYLTSLDYAEFKAKLGASSTQIINTLGYAPVSSAAVTAQIDAVASAANAVNTLVKRDSSGNFTANDIFANSTKTNYVDIYKPSTSFNIRLQAPTSLAANYTLILPTTSGTAGQVLSTDGAGNLSWINSATGSVTSVSGTLNEITSSGGSTPTLGLANIGTAGTYFKVITDSKGRVTSGATTLLLSDLPNTVLNTTSAFAGDISGIISNITVNRIQGVSVTVSSLTANDLLQYDGSKYVNRNIPTCAGNQYLTFTGSSFTCAFDAGASGTVASISVTGPISSTGGANPTLSIAQANSTNNGYLASSDWNNFNNKQAATSAAIVATLGYTPAASGSFTSSQWTTSGTTINYTNGNVGIGTSDPQRRFVVRLDDTSSVTNTAFYNADTTNNNAVVLSLRTNTTGASATTFHQATGIAALVTEHNHNTRNANLGFYTDSASSPSAIRMIITGAGNIGIGTSAPNTKLEVSGGVKISMESAACAVGYAGTLRYNAGLVEFCNGSTWSAFGISSSGLTSLNGSASQTQSFALAAGGTAPNIVTATGVHTFNIPNAASSSVTAGLLSNADYLTFNNKMNATSAAVISALGYAPADSANGLTSATGLLKANNLSDVVSATVARTNLGLGALATANTIDLGSASAIGTLAVARLPSFSGDITSVSGSNSLTLSNSGVSAATYTKVTVDAKGRVTSGSNLSSGDVTTALGYTPASASASTQWNTSGTTINYTNGNVGIGTTNPVDKLHVVGVATVTSGTGNLSIIPDYLGSAYIQSYQGVGVFRPLKIDGLGVTFDAKGSNFAFTTGNVGIGTASPNHLLDVVGNPGSGALVDIRSTDTVDGRAVINFQTAFGGGQAYHIGIGAVGGTNRDFAIRDITASGTPTRMTLNTLGYVGIGTTGPVTRLEVSGGVKIGYESSSCASNFAGTLRYNAGLVEYCNGTTWSAFGISGAGLQSFNGSTSGTQSFANGTTGNVPAFVTANGIHTLNIPFASVGTTTAGLISNADYVNFAGKITSSAAAIAQVLGYVPASATALGNYLVKANNLSDLASSAAARTNLGLGTFATASTIDLGSASATGTLAIARTPAYTGDVTKAAASNTLVLSNSGVTAGTYTKVTVDAKGRVTSSAVLASSDVTTALGYTPAASGSFTSSQWNTSGTAINYMAGNVGIGTTNPVRRLDVQSNTPAIAAFNSAPADHGYLEFYTNAASSTMRTGYVGYPTAGSKAFTVYSQHASGVVQLQNTAGYLKLADTGYVGIGWSSPVTKLDVNGGIRISMESATCAVSYAGTLRYNSGNVEFCNGTTWSAFGVSGAGLQSFNGSTSGTQSFANGTTGNAPAFVTANGIHTLNIPLASAGSVTAGLLSNADYTTFSNKITSSAASIAQVLGYVPASATALANYLVKANNLSDLASSATARTNLGLGTFATASTIDLGSVSATGTLAIARLPAFTGDATIAAASNTIILSNSGVTAGTYTKVTVNAKGRVTSSAALASIDVTTALGYTPASATASTQWNTSGATINYVAGNVGIGTSAPVTRLHVFESSTMGSVGSLNLNNAVMRVQESTGTSLNFDGNTIAAEADLYLGTKNLNNFHLFVSDTTRLFIAGSSGNVGIGTTAPAAQLDISAGASVGAVRLGYSGPTYGAYIDTSSAYSGSWAREFSLGYGGSKLGSFGALATSSTLSYLYLNADQNGVSSGHLNPSMVITPAGHVGVGTTSPANILSVGADLGAMVNPLSSITLGSTNASTLFTLGQDATNRGRIKWTYNSTPANAYMSVGSNVGQSLVLQDNGGNVGIGTTSPVARLDLGTSSANTTTAIFARAADANFRMEAVTGVATNSNGDLIGKLGMRYATSGADTALLKFYRGSTSYDGSVAITTSGTDRFIVKGDGNVGIGTTSPQQKLDVNGEVVAALGTWANFRAIGGNYAAMIRNDGVNTYIPLLTASGNQYGTWNTLRPMSVNNANGNVSLADGKVYVEHSTGNVGIGLTNPGTNLHVHSSGTPLRLSNPTASWTVGPEGGTGSFIIYNGGGTGQWMANGGTSWAANSDRRLKKNIRPIESALEKALQLNGMTYLYNTDPASTPRRVGVIAQDVEKVLPEAIERKSNGMLGVKYVEIIPLLINALKEFYSVWFHDSNEIHAEIAKIKAENAQLRNLAEDASSRAIKAEAQVDEIKSALCELHPKLKVCIKIK